MTTGGVGVHGERPKPLALLVGHGDHALSGHDDALPGQLQMESMGAKDTKATFEDKMHYLRELRQKYGLPPTKKKQ